MVRGKTQYRKGQVDILHINETTALVLMVMVLFLFGVWLCTVLSTRRIKKERKQYEESLTVNTNMAAEIDELNRKIMELANEINEIKTDKENERNTAHEIEQIRKVVVTKDPTLDCMLADKRNLAEKKRLEFFCRVPSGMSAIPMEKTDKIRLFANLLDNAIEAAERSVGQRYVSITIQPKESNYFIKVENSKRDADHVVENEFRTTKKNAEEHGRGVRIIRSIVDAYGGTIQFKDAGDRFEIAIML